MKLFVKILVFVLVAFVVNMNATSVVIVFPDFQKTTASFSFHNETPKTIYKVLEKDLADCCQNGEKLVDYRNWAIRVKAVATKTGLANSKAMGSAMEQALGMSSSKTAINIDGRTRFPDRLANGLLEESKNVKHLNFTGQLRDYLNYSQQNGLDFMLHTRPSTTFSKPLQKLIDQKIILHNPVPGF